MKKRIDVVRAQSRILQDRLHFLQRDKKSKETPVCNSVSLAKRVYLWAVHDLPGGKKTIENKLILDGKFLAKLTGDCSGTFHGIP